MLVPGLVLRVAHRRSRQPQSLKLMDGGEAGMDAKSDFDELVLSAGFTWFWLFRRASAAGEISCALDFLSACDSAPGCRVTVASWNSPLGCLLCCTRELRRSFRCSSRFFLTCSRLSAMRSFAISRNFACTTM